MSRTITTTFDVKINGVEIGQIPLEITVNLSESMRSELERLLERLENERQGGDLVEISAQLN